MVNAPYIVNSTRNEVAYNLCAIMLKWWSYKGEGMPSVGIAELQIKPKSKSNQTKNLEGTIIAWFLSFSLSCPHQDSSDVTLAFEDAD